MIRNLTPALVILAISVTGLYASISFLAKQSTPKELPPHKPKFAVGQCFVSKSQTECELNKESWEKSCNRGNTGKVLEIGKHSYHVVYFLSDNTTMDTTEDFFYESVLDSYKCPKGFEE